MTQPSASDIRETLRLWAERREYCRAKIAPLQESLDLIERDWGKMEKLLKELENTK